MIQLHFDRGEACAESHKLQCERQTIPFDNSDGEWVQLTYDMLCTQAGDIIAFTNGTCGCWMLDDVPFSDIVIEFT